MKDFILFFFKQKKIEDILIKNRAKLIISFFFINFFLMILSRILTIELEDLGIIDKIIKEKRNDNIITFILLTGFFMPISEEIINRLWLRFSRVNFGISLSFLIFIYLYVKIFNNDIKSILTPSSNLYVTIFFSVVVFLITYKLSGIYKDKIDYIFNKHSYMILILSSFLFSALHLTMFNFTSHKNILYIPFFLTPFFISGVLLGYLRLKLGVIYSILFHIAHNSILVILKILLTK